MLGKLIEWKPPRSVLRIKPFTRLLHNAALDQMLQQEQATHWRCFATNGHALWRPRFDDKREQKFAGRERFKLSKPEGRHFQNMPDQKDKAQEKNRLERLQEEHGDADAKHSGGAGASGGNSGAGKSGASKVSATGTPDDLENLAPNN